MWATMLGVLIFSLLAQDPQGRAVFSSRAELVVLHVSVIDRRAGFVPGLPRDAFTVYEDGRAQPIRFFENEDTPVTVGLVVDNSGSMLPRREAVTAAGMAFAASSNPSDELFTINFNERVWLGLPRDRAFTSDRDELRSALTRAGARGETALFDAIDEGMRHLDAGHCTRKILIVLSDGGDNASHSSFDEVLDTALRKDVVIYAIGIYDRDDRDAKPQLLRRLAAATGGEAFFPEANEEVQPALERIARDIRGSYSIGYVPPKGPGDRAPHRLRVEVHPPDGRKLEARARSAYIHGDRESRHEQN